MRNLNNCVALLALLTLLPAATFSAGVYDPSLQLLMRSLKTRAEANTTTPSATLLGANGAAAFHLSQFGVSGASGVDSYVVGVAPLCIAFNTGTSSAVAFTVDDIASLLNGTLDAVKDDSASGRFVASGQEMRVLLPPANTTLGRALLQSLVAMKARSYTSASSYPSEVVWSGNVTLYPADEDGAAAFVHATPMSIAIISQAIAVQHSLPCAKYRLPQSNQCDLVLSSRMPQAANAYVSVNHTALTCAVSRATAPVYPLVGCLVLHVNRTAACGASDTAGVEAFAKLLLLDPFFDAALLSAGMLPMASTESNKAMVRLVRLSCGQMTVVPSGGGSTILTMMTQLARQYAMKTDVLIEYPSGGTASLGRAAVIAGTMDFAASAVPVTAAELAINPHLQMLPALVMGVSVCHSLADVPDGELLLPRCLIPALFNGSVQYWNDAAIAEANPSLTLPHAPIEIVVRQDVWGTTKLLLDGLRAIELSCYGTSNTVVAETWTLPNATGVTSDDAILQLLNSRNVLTYLATAVAVQNGIAQATVLDPYTESRFAPTPSVLTAALESSSMDSTSLLVTSNLQAAPYPFFAAAYFVFDASLDGNCTRHRFALEFVKWALTDSDASSTTFGTRLVPIPSYLATLIVERMQAVATCDGALLFPPAAMSTSLSSATIGGIAAGGTVFVVGVLLVVFLLGRSGSRNNKHAPKDVTKPFAVVFTDIQSSTTLWNEFPEQMPQWLDTHHATMRACIAAHGGYEVKTIGDAFMVAFASPTSAVAFALDVQERLYEADWGSGDMDTLYQEMQRVRLEAGEKDIPPLLPAQAYAGSWKGLRVRIGINYALGDIQLDPVTKSYDYYGTVVNTAARVEDVANGGQVVITQETLDVVDLKQLGHVQTTSMGAHTLRGLSAPTPMVQVSRPPLSSRQFPPLRIDHSPDDDEDNDDALGDCVSQVSGVSLTASSQHPTSGLAKTLQTLFGPVSQKEKKSMLTQLCKSWRVQGRDADSNDEKMNRLSHRLDKILQTKGLGLRSSNAQFIGGGAFPNTSRRPSQQSPRADMYAMAAVHQPPHSEPGYHPLALTGSATPV